MSNNNTKCCSDDNEVKEEKKDNRRCKEIKIDIDKMEREIKERNEKINKMELENAEASNLLQGYYTTLDDIQGKIKTLMEQKKTMDDAIEKVRSTLGSHVNEVREIRRPIEELKQKLKEDRKLLKIKRKEEIKNESLPGWKTFGVYEQEVCLLCTNDLIKDKMQLLHCGHYMCKWCIHDNSMHHNRQIDKILAKKPVYQRGSSMADKIVVMDDLNKYKTAMSKKQMELFRCPGLEHEITYIHCECGEKECNVMEQRMKHHRKNRAQEEKEKDPNYVSPWHTRQPSYGRGSSVERTTTTTTTTTRIVRDVDPNPPSAQRRRVVETEVKIDDEEEEGEFVNAVGEAIDDIFAYNPHWSDNQNNRESTVPPPWSDGTRAEITFPEPPNAWSFERNPAPTPITQTITRITVDPTPPPPPTSFEPILSRPRRRFGGPMMNLTSQTSNIPPLRFPENLREDASRAHRNVEGAMSRLCPNISSLPTHSANELIQRFEGISQPQFEASRMLNEPQFDIYLSHPVNQEALRAFYQRLQNENEGLHQQGQ